MADTLTVQVTQKHIDDGKPTDGCNCPVALAIREHFPGLVGPHSVHVRAIYATVYLPDGRVLDAPLPREAQHFIKVFDASEEALPADPFTPFEFTLTWHDSHEDGIS